MKEPRYKLTIEVTLEEYLGLLWSIDGLHGDLRADRQTVRKIASFYRHFTSEHEVWRRIHFKCARKQVTQQARSKAIRGGRPVQPKAKTGQRVALEPHEWKLFGGLENT